MFFTDNGSVHFYSAGKSSRDWVSLRLKVLPGVI